VRGVRPLVVLGSESPVHAPAAAAGSALAKEVIERGPEIGGEWADDQLHGLRLGQDLVDVDGHEDNRRAGRWTLGSNLLGRRLGRGLGIVDLDGPKRVALHRSKPIPSRETRAGFGPLYDHLANHPSCFLFTIGMDLNLDNDSMHGGDTPFKPEGLVTKAKDKL
jgi:hypothetical protein